MKIETSLRRDMKQLHQLLHFRTISQVAKRELATAWGIKEATITDANIKDLNRALAFAEINTDLRLRHFLAQACMLVAHHDH